MNSLNETDGYIMGHPACWEDPESIGIAQPCSDEGMVCVTDMKAEWTLYGKQLFTIQRGCGFPPRYMGCQETINDAYKARVSTNLRWTFVSKMEVLVVYRNFGKNRNFHQ